jgi:hypothetical protein
MVVYFCSASVAVCAQKSTDPKAFILLKHITGSAKHIAAEVIEFTLKYIEPRFCDYSHEIQFGEIGEGDLLTWRRVKNKLASINLPCPRLPSRTVSSAEPVAEAAYLLVGRDV